MAYKKINIGAATVLYDENSGAILVAQASDVDIANDAKSATHTHTAKATAEEISGATAFDAGATVRVVGMDGPIYVGGSKANAEANRNGAPAGVPVYVTLGATATTFWLDAETGGLVVCNQLS